MCCEVKRCGPVALWLPARGSWVQGAEHKKVQGRGDSDIMETRRQGWVGARYCEQAPLAGCFRNGVASSAEGPWPGGAARRLWPWGLPPGIGLLWVHDDEED